MRKALGLLGIAVMVVLGFCVISTEAAENNFSGTWVLDKEKAQDLPSNLKSYTVVVTQDGQELVVETKIEGGRGMGEGGPGGDFPGGGPPPSGPGDEGMGGPPEGGGPPPGGPSGGPPSGVMALRMVVPKATYSLEGKETTVELEEGPMRGTAKLKAKWAKDGKTLELSSVRDMDFGGQSVTFTSKERWTLSEDGAVLKVQRSVDTPMGTDTVKLTFRKGQAESQAPPQ